MLIITKNSKTKFRFVSWKKQLLIFLLQYCTASVVFSQGVSIPYYSGFDSPAEKAGWQQIRTGVLSSFSWNYVGGAFSIPTCLSHDYNVGGNPTDTVVDWFVSPPVNFTAQGKISLKVQTGGFSTPFPDNCEIWFGINNPNPSTGNFVLIGNLSYMLPQFQWLDTTISIPYLSDSGYIAFKYKTIGAAWSTYAIDNINISLDSSVSVYENKNPEKVSIKIFPNPFSSVATISVEETLLSSPLEIRLLDVSGREIKRITNVKNKEITIDRGNLAEGFYSILISQQDKIIAAGKIIIE